MTQDANRPTLGSFGGVGTVTGSKYLLETTGRCVLLECGPLGASNCRPAA